MITTNNPNHFRLIVVFMRLSMSQLTFELAKEVACYLYTFPVVLVVLLDSVPALYTASVSPRPPSPQSA